MLYLCSKSGSTRRFDQISMPIDRSCKSKEGSYDEELHC